MEYTPEVLEGLWISLPYSILLFVILFKVAIFVEYASTYFFETIFEEIFYLFHNFIPFC